MSSIRHDKPQVLLYPKISKLKEGEIDIPDEELIRTKDGRAVLTSINVIESIHPSWYPLLLGRGLSINERLKSIFKKGYENGFIIRPLPEETFSAFSMPISHIKAVVVGQDPYPGWDKDNKRPIACGLSFATPSDITPPSLERIRVSIARNFGSISITDGTRPNSLQGWINQGVLLLNNTPFLFISYDDALEETISPRLKAALEVPFKIWNGMTEIICKEIIAENPRCPFILMGRASHYLERVVGRSFITSHPSTRSDCDFTGECFKSVPEINWKNM